MQPKLQRVAVIGLAGSGKSTLAANLAQIIGGVHIELDQLHWEANWTPAPADVFRARVTEVVAGDCWVACGNYSIVRDLVWTRADHIVWLDYGLPRIQARVLHRTLRRLWSSEQVCNGNRESFRSLFGHNSLLAYNRDAIIRHRDLYPNLLAFHATARTVHHRSPKETETWLAGMTAGKRSPCR
jgi:adenylate kinase family enzyme